MITSSTAFGEWCKQAKHLSDMNILDVMGPMRPFVMQYFTIDKCLQIGAEQYFPV